MKIQFNSVIPAPIPTKNVEKSEVWGQELLFSPGEIRLIVAESGKGKTTFINIILGLRKDYEGVVTIDGKNVKTMSLEQLLLLRRDRISVVPQNLQLFEELTAWENLILKNNIHHLKQEQELEQMMERLEVAEYKNRPIGKMSLGQRQRIAIIRSLCQNFEYLLLDEPFSHLDSRNSSLAWELIEEESLKRNAGVLISSLTADFGTGLNNLSL